MPGERGKGGEQAGKRKKEMADRPQRDQTSAEQVCLGGGEGSRGDELAETSPRRPKTDSESRAQW